MNPSLQRLQVAVLKGPKRLEKVGYSSCRSRCCLFYKMPFLREILQIQKSR